MQTRHWLHPFVALTVLSALVLGTFAPVMAQTPAPIASPAADAPAEPKTELEMVAALITERFKDWAPTIEADALYENLNDSDATNDPLIVSVRKPEDYAKGHIPGAVNIFWKNIATPESLAALPKDKPIVVYCYTGHTGQIAATVLRLLGYDTTNLKYGMMGWTDDDAVLATPRFEGAAGYPTETTLNPLPAAGALPELKTGLTAVEEIVAARANEFLATWTPTISADDVFENQNDGDATNDPFVLSVRKPEDYAKGHVAGAVNIPWKQVGDLTQIASLPTDKPIVVYCYTGHTGQIAATALGLMGYNPVNMRYGMMGWTEDDDVLATTRFVEPAGYPVETTVNPLPTAAPVKS